jgi:hypothetical protein
MSGRSKTSSWTLKNELEKFMSAPDQVIHEILKHTGLNPSEATAQLAACYPDSWVDKGRCASKNLKSYKKRHAFKPGNGPAEGAIVVLGEGKERAWMPREGMQRHHILMRIELISRKNREHNQATRAEVKYWHESVQAAMAPATA